MPSVAGMGLEFSCGEDPKLVPAVATGAEQHGAAPEEFVEIMTAALKDAKYGTRPTPKVTLEALKQKGWRPPAIAIPPATPGTSPGKRGVTWRVAAERAARSGYLTSPRSVHVCMEHGVDPATLLERDLSSFAETGLTESLQAAAHAHHEEVRKKTLATLLEARAALPANFQPPSVGVDKLSKSFKMNATPGENSADAEINARQKEEEAKRLAQRERLEANKRSAIAETQKLQKEFAEKTTRVEARARVMSKKLSEQEKERTAEQVRRTAEQTRQAAIYESDERAAALRRVDEETAARKAAQKAAALEKKAEAARRAESAARDAARAAKTAAIRARAEAQTEALRLQLEAREKKLAEFETATRLDRDKARPQRGPNLGGAAIKPSVSRNLELRASEEEQRRRDLVRERLRRDARAMSARMSEDDLEARLAREKAAAEKRAKAESAKQKESEARAAAFASAEAKQAAKMEALAKTRAAELERVRFERALKASERAQRVQNLSRAKAVEKARLLRKLEEDSARTEMATSTRRSMAESRQLENCRAALEKSTRQQIEEEALRKETRERWLKSQEPDLELEARIAAEAEQKARLAAEAKAAEKAAAAARVAAKHKRSASQVSAYSQKSEKTARSQVSYGGGSQVGGSRAHSTADGGAEVDADAEVEFRREQNVEDGEGGLDSGDGDESAPAFVAAEGAEAPVEGGTDAPVDGEAAEEAPAAVDEPEAADVDDEDTVVA